MDYNSLTPLNDEQKHVLSIFFRGILADIKNVSANKVLVLIKNIPIICRLTHNSIKFTNVKEEDSCKIHPIAPRRGEVFDAEITEGVGSELNGHHLVIIIQNPKGNIYSDKVNIVPIVGDGNKINPKYQLAISNNDLEFGKLKKNPSRIIVTDIMTIDKARLGRRTCTIKPEIMKKLDIMLKNQLNL